MKKLLASIALAFATVAGASAQSVITGTVVDKDGSPIPGAKVEIVGSTENTITELDGTFRIETSAPARELKVRYVGMGSKKQEITPNMTVVLGGRSGKNEFAWIVRAGAGMANMKGDEDDADFVLAPTASVGVEIPLGGNFYLMSALEYKKKGFEYSYDDSKETYSLHYLQLPVSAGYRFHFGRSFSLTANAGAYAAYGIKGNAEWTSDGYTEEYDPFKDEEEFEAEIKRFDAGVSAGFDLAWKRLVLGIQANVGFLNISNGDGEAKNNAWYLTLGYRF